MKANWDLLIENHFEKKNKLDMNFLVEMVEEIINEEYYYKDSNIPFSFETIIRYMKEKYGLSADVDYKQGVVVIEFTGVQSRKERDEIIKDLHSKGYVDKPEYKKGTGIYDTATTNFKYKYPNGRVVDVKIRLKHGGEGGPFGSGSGYEKQVGKELEDQLTSKGYTVKVEGGATKSPDVVVTKNGKETKLETKSVLGSEFGQFSVRYDGTGYQSANSKIANILGRINRAIRLKFIPDIQKTQEKEKLKLWLSNIGDLVEDYYSTKEIDYIIVGDRIYSTTDNALAKAASVPRFRDSAKNGYARLREKEGKLMLALYVTDLDEKAPLYFEEDTLNTLFP